MGNASVKNIALQTDVETNTNNADVSIISNNKCNYDCPVCTKTGKTPNMAGRFFLINDDECKCNACNSVFPKALFYKAFKESA